ncbi:glycosyltransferase 61 family protein, partial [Arthrospira platensis SPKY1]|nr:glycosyltransferase 61 family protein [Arthrospira platensis SPKY1]
GIDTQNLEYISKDEWLFFDYLFVPSRVVDLEANRYLVMPESIKFLNGLVNKIDSLSSPYGKLVYISRSEATTRIVKNEEDIEAKLAKLGFDIVFPGTLNTKEKISTFANAEIVIGAVGNGIISTPFMRQNSEVVLLTTTFLHRTLNYHTMFCSMNNNPCHIVVESDKVIASGKSHYDNLGYFSIIDVDILCENVRQIMYQKGITSNDISSKKITSLTYPKGSREYMKQMDKHKLMSLLDLDAPGYKEYLKRFHQKLQPNAYLEIGVETGASLILSNSSTICVGVDPVPNIKVPLPKNIKLFEMTSDAFFENINVISEFENNPINLAFLDGLHEFDQTLKDFINTEKYSKKSGYILLH